MITQIFVYGTLKRGQCRDILWPCDPIAVIPAMTRGTLYDRQDYPAMTVGQDLVAGECWRFREQDIASVLRTLDEIEGANQPGTPDLYHRVEVDCWQCSEADVAGRLRRLKVVGRAFAYHYARDIAEDGFSQISPTREGQTVCWPPLDRPEIP